MTRTFFEIENGDNMLKEKLRSEIPDDMKWDLSELFKSDDEFNKCFEEVLPLTQEFEKYKGKLNNSKDIYDYFKFNDEVSLKVEKIYVYAFCKFDEDATNTVYQEMKGKVENLLSKFSLATSYVMPELEKLSEEDINKFMEENENLRKYEYDFKCLLRQKKHILSLEEENILATLNMSLDLPENISDYLRDADMKFDTIKDEEGNTVELNNTNYSKYITSKDRRVRKEAFDKLYKGYENLQNTFACAYSSKVSSSNKIAHLRKYKGAREAALDSSFVSNKIYDNLISTVNKNLNIMDDYYSMKKKVMGLDEIHIYDIYSKLIPNYDKKYSYDEAKKMVLDALSILGDNYVNNLKRAFDEKWIDVMPNKGKTGGAYERGCFNTHPYVLLNFIGDYHDVSTIAHELGHAMHSYYSDRHNDYAHHQYEIFVAEVASQVNEIILADYLLKHTDIKEEKLYILDNLMELFKGSIIRQTMFAEFEDLMHKKEDSGEVLTSEFISSNYYDIYKKYSGKNMITDEAIRYEWARIPHFYYNFYVYQYSTGLASAAFIASNIINKKSNALEDYLKFLSLGGSMDATEELKVAGVDISSPEVIQNALDMFKGYINEFEKLYEK